MTTAEVWNSLDKIVSSWNRSEVIQRFRSELPQNQRRGSTVNEGVARIVQAGQTIESHPLQFYKAFPHMDFSLDLRTREFMADAELIERSVTMLTCWIRSRLPLYPMIPAPQLAPGSFHTSQDNSFDVPWFQEALSSGLQYQGSPPQIENNLEVRSSPHAISLASSLKDTKEWKSYAAASRKVEPSTRSELSEARRLLASKLRSAEVDVIPQEDPRIFLNQRRELTEEVLETLSQTARVFADAFHHVDTLINFVVVDVLSQLIAFGPPRQLKNVANVEIVGGQPPRANLDLSSGLATIGRLYWIESSITDDAVQIDSSSFGHDVVHGTRARTGGKLLTNSFAAWKRP